MEAATKNKKGRPPVFSPTLYTIMGGENKRTAQNQYYAGKCIVNILNQKPGSFFVTSGGKFRRQGIAEKIGRIYTEGLLTADQCKELAQTVIADYKNGQSAKEIEHNLSLFKKMLKG